MFDARNPSQQPNTFVGLQCRSNILSSAPSSVPARAVHEPQPRDGLSFQLWSESTLVGPFCPNVRIGSSSSGSRNPRSCPRSGSPSSARPVSAHTLARRMLTYIDMSVQAGYKSRVRVDVDQDFWGHNALSLAERLPLSDIAGAKCVELSLGQVHRIDEAGLAMLVRLYSHLRVRGSHLQLVDVPVFVHELFERVGFSRLVSYANGSDCELAHRTVALNASLEA
jgi:ABC-type transporter Mla MlaB component